MPTVEQIKKFYENKKDLHCPITEEFIKLGYQQERGGYINYAYEQEIEVDFSKAKPTQWWHLIKSYCDRTDLKKTFPRSITCGEMYIWMAEVSGAFENKELEDLAKRALDMATKVNRKNKNLPPLKISAKGNKMIRDYCYDRIMDRILNNIEK